MGYGHEVWSAGNYYFWVPMVAPFCGCTFGGFLYDLFLFTGDSPINLPYMGLYRFIPWVDNAQYEGRRWDPQDKKQEQEHKDFWDEFSNSGGAKAAGPGQQAAQTKSNIGTAAMSKRKPAEKKEDEGWGDW